MTTISSAYTGSRQTMNVTTALAKEADRPRRGADVPIVMLSPYGGNATAVYIDELVDALDELSIEGLTVEYEKPFALPTTPGAIIEADLRGRTIRFIRSGGRDNARWINTLDSLTRTDGELKTWFQIPGNPTTFTIVSL